MTHTYDRDQTMPRRLAIVLTTLFLTSLVCLSLMTFDHVKYIALQARGHLSAETIRGALTVSDWAILCVTTALALALIALPAARKGFVTLWSKDTLLVWMPVGAALFWCGHAILGSGLIVTGDAGTHVAKVNHLAMALRDGGSLFWDNYFFGGSTLLQFTGPVFHWTAALIDLAVEDPTQSIKFAAFCIRLIAALFMYLLMRGYGLSRTTGSLTALFYGGAFFMTYMEIVRSSFPQLINFAAMPAIIFFVERILAGRAVIGGGTAGLSLVAILFIGNHQPTALIFGLLVAIYVCIRLSMTGGNGATMVALAATAMFIAVGSVFFLLPFVLERGMTADDFSAASLITFAWPSVATLHDFVVWGSAGAGPVYAAYVGLPMLGCVAAGGYAIWTNSQTLECSLRSTWSLMLGLASISLFVRGAYVREATFTFFFLCVAAGVGLEMATRGHRRGSLLAAVFVTTLLDAGPLAVQPWTRRDFVPIAEAGEYLADRARNARVVEVQQIDGKAYIAADPTLSPLAYGRLQILAGPHKQDATKAHNGFAALLKIAQQDLRTDGRLEPRTRNMLAVANVGWVVGTAAKGMGLPNNLEGTIMDPVLGTYLPIPEATPFIVSGRLETMTRPMAFDVAPFWDFYFDHETDESLAAMASIRAIGARMQPDLTTRQAATILIPPRSAEPEWDVKHEGQAPDVLLLSYAVGPGIVRLSVEADRNGFIRLAHPLGLGTRVTQNGAAVTPLADVQSLIVLPLHEGRNDFVVAPMPSNLRRLCFWITVSGIAGLSGIAVLRGMQSGARSGNQEATGSRIE